MDIAGDEHLDAEDVSLEKVRVRVMYVFVQIRFLMHELSCNAQIILISVSWGSRPDPSYQNVIDAVPPVPPQPPFAV